MVNIIIQCGSITELAKTKAMLDSQCFEWDIKVLMTNSLWKDIRKSISPINEERPDIKKVLWMDIIPIVTND